MRRSDCPVHLNSTISFSFFFGDDKVFPEHLPLPDKSKGRLLQNAKGRSEKTYSTGFDEDLGCRQGCSLTIRCEIGRGIYNVGSIPGEPGKIACMQT